jgi:hypothetical protein
MAQEQMLKIDKAKQWNHPFVNYRYYFLENLLQDLVQVDDILNYTWNPRLLFGFFYFFLFYLLFFLPRI